VDLSAFSTSGLGELSAILLAAVVGKFLGAFGGARLSGLPVRYSAVLGTLMNTRGLTELIVLSIGAEVGLLDARLYTLMVVMALVTTAMTGPLLALLYPPRMVIADIVAPGGSRDEEVSTARGGGPYGISRRPGPGRPFAHHLATFHTAARVP
jgi:hypothetical protein